MAKPREDMLRIDGEDIDMESRAENREVREILISGNVEKMEESAVQRFITLLMPRGTKCEIKSVQRGDSEFIAEVKFASRVTVVKVEEAMKQFNKQTKSERDIKIQFKENLIPKQFKERHDLLNKGCYEIGLAVEGSYQKKKDFFKKELSDITADFDKILGHGLIAEEFQRLCDREKVLKQKVEMLDQGYKIIRDTLTIVREKLQAESFPTNHSDKFFTELEREMRHEQACFEKSLPIYSFKEKILSELKSNQVIILTAETGSGKSTQLVQYLYFSKLFQGCIVCTQPRKFAAKSLAQFVAREMGCSVGTLVGYNCGAQKKKTSSTRILFATDSVVLDKSQKDPLLKKFSCIIVDEAHERSLNTDILLGIVKRCLQQRQDLKVLVTSATIDPDTFLHYFAEEPPLVKIPGSCFPVEVNWGFHSEDLISKRCMLAVDQVVRIVKEEEEKGDILVFLATPFDTERASQLLQEKSLKNVIITKLHGRLSPAEQMNVFKLTPHGKRKVVFATNSAETSITIPGIKYVVDSGVVKRRSLSAENGLSTMALGLLSQSSANQRKGRAGRTCSGKCFRLYSKECYDQLCEREEPEIRRVELSKACLRLLALNLDPKNFDYVTRPSEVALTIALEELKFLDAVDANVITPLGKEILTFPVQPGLAKVILIANLKKHALFETMVVAALLSTNREVFLSSQTQDDKADQRRLQHSDENGDLVMLLNVFKLWWLTGETKKREWCKSNGICHATMVHARTVLNEIPLKVLHEFHDSAIYPFLRKLFIYCFGRNLCVFHSHPTIGMTVLEPHLITVHPASSLSYIENSRYEYAYYGSLFQDWNSVITTVTPVDKIWVEEELVAYKKIPDIKYLPHVIQRTISRKTGDTILKKYFLGFKHERLRDIENRLKNDLHTCVKLNCSIDEGSITVHCFEEHYEDINAYLTNVLQNAIEELSTRYQTMPVLVGEEFCDSGSLVVSPGFRVSCLRLPGEFADIKVSAKAKSSLSNILDQIELPPDTERPKVTLQKHAAFIACNSPGLASCIAQNLNRNNYWVDSVIRPLQTFGQGIQISCRWTRRSYSNFGQCFFKKREDAFLAAMFLSSGIRSPEGELTPGSIIAQVEVIQYPEPHLRLFDLVSGLRVETLKRALKLQVSAFSIENVQMKRDIPYQTTYTDYRNIWCQMKKTLSEELGSAPYSFRLSWPLQKNNDWIATLSFDDIRDAKFAVEKLEGKCFPFTKNSPLSVEPYLTRSLPCSDRIYEIIEKDLRASIDRINKKTVDKFTYSPIRIKKGSDKTRRLISIKANNLDEFSCCFNDVSSLVEGCVISIRDRILFAELATTAGFWTLQKIARTTGTVVELQDGVGIRIYGGYENVAEASKQCKSLIRTLEEGETICRIQLKQFGKIGLLKALISKYGFDLKDLSDHIFHDQRITVDVRQHELRFISSDDNLNKVMMSIEDCARDLEDGVRCTPPTCEKCPRCDTRICSNKNTYRLQLCGHLYCRRCLMILMASMDIPLACIEKNCGSLLAIEDFNKLVSDTDPLFGVLREKAIDDYVARHRKSIARCEAPTCNGLVRKPATLCSVCDGSA